MNTEVISETDCYHTATNILTVIVLNSPLPYFKVNICPLPLPHFASIFFAYLWSFRWPNYIVTLPRYFSFRLPHLNINTGPLSDELEGNIQRKSQFLFFSQWNGYNHFRIALDFFICIRNSLDFLFFSQWNGYSHFRSDLNWFRN
jgi:hypothetical protein